MSDRVALEGLQRVIDQVYRDRDLATRRDVYRVASAHLDLSSDVLVLLNETPEGTYTREQMVEAINKALENRGGDAALR